MTTANSRTTTRPHHEVADDDSRFLAVDGVDVHHKVAGSGPPGMLLFHHFYGNVLTWRKVMPGLSEVGTVAAFDRPGFGFTQRLPRDRWNGTNPYTRAWSARAAVRLLDELGLERAVLIGASAGGTSAIETTLRFPDRVAALVLISPAITGDVGPPAALRAVLNANAGIASLAPRIITRLAGEIDQRRVAGGWHDPGRAESSDVEAYARGFDVDGWARGFFEVMTAEDPPNLRADLSRIPVPTLVVTGDSDRTVSPRASQHTAGAIPDARFEVIADCGHTPHEERPDALLDTIVPFIEDVAAGDPEG